MYLLNFIEREKINVAFYVYVFYERFSTAFLYHPFATHEYVVIFPTLQSF
jgi:hypothetical protein